MLSIPASCISSRANRKTTYSPYRRRTVPLLDAVSAIERIWQVSQSGKPHCTASSKTPIGIFSFAKLASGLCPLGTPSKVFRPLHTGAGRLSSDLKIIPRMFLQSSPASLRALPLHPAKGTRSPLETCEKSYMKGI